MKKVLIIIGKLCIGGAERVARDIGFYSDPGRYEIHYLVFGSEVGAYEQELENKGCRIIHAIPPSSGYVQFWKMLTKLIREEQYDVIHSHTMFNSGWAMMAGKLYGVPVRICHSHSIRGNEKRGLLKNLYENTMRFLILCFATHYVACGKNAGQWLYGKKVFDRKGILIVNGIDLERFSFDSGIRQKIRSQLGVEDRFVIGHVGHLAAVKNQAFLVNMMPEILKRKPEALLLLLGEGPDREKLETMIRQLNLEDNVKMMGNVSNVQEYLSAMDVFAFPSFYEGTPLAVIEAQANGLPCVISSRIPEDVNLTDLVHVLSLGDVQTLWADVICSKKRECEDIYVMRIRQMGVHTDDMLKKICSLYEG